MLGLIASRLSSLEYALLFMFRGPGVIRHRYNMLLVASFSIERITRRLCAGGVLELVILAMNFALLAQTSSVIYPRRDVPSQKLSRHVSETEHANKVPAYLRSNHTVINSADSGSVSLTSRSVSFSSSFRASGQWATSARISSVSAAFVYQPVYETSPQR